MTCRNNASFFFFSSRRRHTRFDCDWSSDVCSSDLIVAGLAMTAAGLMLTGLTAATPTSWLIITYLVFGLGFGVVNAPITNTAVSGRSEEHTSELQSQSNLVCRLLLEKKKKKRVRST